MKTLDNFKIITQKGKIYDMAADFNVLVKSFRVSSPKPHIETEKIAGQHGEKRIEKTWGSRRITTVCSIFAVDPYDVALLRSDVFKKLMDEDEFYVVSDAELGKRWLVEVASEWTPDRIGTYGEFTIDFVCHGAYAESMGTSLDPKTFDLELWQIGQGLNADGMEYSFTTSTFRLYNPSDKEINPRNTPLVITFKGASTNLKITNTTTGDEWTYTGTTAAGDTIKLDGIRSTKNNLSIFRDTNHKVITLAEGWNDFVITGASGAFTIDFDFRFYYL